MKRIARLLLGTCVLVGGLGIAMAQETTPPPKVLSVQREFINPGKAGRHMRKPRALSCKL